MRESVLQEAGFRLATDNGSQFAWRGIPAMPLKVIFFKMYGMQRNQFEFVEFI